MSKNNFLKVLAGIMVVSVFGGYVYADEIADVKTRLGSINNTQLGLPSAPTGKDQKGFIATIIQRLLSPDTGKIRPVFLDNDAIVTDIFPTPVNNAVVKWNSTTKKFESSSITDNGTTTTIGGDFNVQGDTSLNNFTSSSITDNGTTTTIGGDFNVQGDIYQGGTVFSGGKFVNGNNVADAVYTAGNVGIGTMAPTQALDVAGGTRFRVGEGLEIVGDDNYFGTNLDARILRMTEGNSSIVDGGLAIQGLGGDGTETHIASFRGNGNVGIGVVNPTEKLEISGGVLIQDTGTIAAANPENGWLKLGTTSGLSMDGNEIYFHGTDGYIGAIGDHSLNFQIGTSNKLKIASNGNIGIGTTTPTQKLDVAGAVKIGDAAECNADTAGSIRFNGGTIQYCSNVSGGSTSGDISLPTCTDNQILSYDATSSSWVCSDGVDGSGSGTPLHRFLVGLTPDQVLGGAAEDILFDFIAYDTASGYNATTGEYTIPATGLWQFGGMLSFKDNDTTLGNNADPKYLRIQRNGTTLDAIRIEAETEESTGASNVTVSTLFSLDAGDVVKLNISAGNSAIAIDGSSDWWGRMVPTTSGGSGGTASLPTCTDNQILSYDATSSSWVCSDGVDGSGTSLAGTEVAFHAYSDVGQSITTSLARINFNVEQYDTNNDYDPATGRFQPSVAGRYLVNTLVAVSGVNANSRLRVDLRKNGVSVSRGYSADMDTSRDHYVQTTKVIEANGTSDYFDVYALLNEGSETVFGSSTQTYFQATLLIGSSSDSSLPSCSDGEILTFDSGSGNWECDTIEIQDPFINIDSNFKTAYGDWSGWVSASGQWLSVTTADCGVGWKPLLCSWRHDYLSSASVSNYGYKVWSISGTQCIGNIQTNEATRIGASIAAMCVKSN